MQPSPSTNPAMYAASSLVMGTYTKAPTFKSQAALKKEDNEAIQKMVGKLSGVPERDVQAAETFSGGDS